MFRNRFTDGFSKSLPHFGPQELERDVVASVPGDRAELFLCAILGLLLNRKQDVKYVGCALRRTIALTTGATQARSLWEGFGRRRFFAQKPMAPELGGQEPPVREHDVQLHDPGRPRMQIIDIEP